MLADLIDAVIGVDTHRDTHHAELALPTGAPIRTCSISNDSAGYAQLLSWAFEHAPGPRLVMSIEGTRSYGAGLARAAAAAGFTVIECEQPTRTRRRGKGKSDPIDAHLAVLTALQLNADRLPTPRADGDREALRILLCARQELTTTNTAQTNRLRALLRDGDDTDRRLARARLTDAVLARIAVGVANPRAHGHATTSTATAAVIAAPAGRPATSHPITVATASTSTAGTNTAATRSTSRCTAVLPSWACSTSRVIRANCVSAPTRVRW
jgi:hypothetical protein